MKTPAGFTLLEVLLVIALIAICARFSAYEGITSYTQVSAQASLTQERLAELAASGKSLRHICDGDTCEEAAAHGVYTTSTSTIIFQGPSFLERDQDQDFVIPQPLGSEHADSEIRYAL